MVHLVYCDNTGKKGEKVLDKILNGTKTMAVRGAAGRKIPHSRVYQGEKFLIAEFTREKPFILWKKEAL